MNGTVACPDCGEDCQVKMTKAGKPYYRCQPCGTQHFYRMNEGIIKLKARIKRVAEPDPEPNRETVSDPSPKKTDNPSAGFGFL